MWFGIILMCVGAAMYGGGGKLLDDRGNYTPTGLILRMVGVLVLLAGTVINAFRYLF